MPLKTLFGTFAAVYYLFFGPPVLFLFGGCSRYHRSRHGRWRWNSSLMKWHMMKGRRIWHVESLTVEYRYEALPVEIKNKFLFSYASLITGGRHYKLRGKIDDLPVIFNGISISTQPFLMKMYKKRNFNKNMGIFQHHTCSFEVCHFDPCQFFHCRGAH